jgi:hypothetical protein
LNGGFEEWGQTGDFFGGIFTFLTFLVMILTFRETQKASAIEKFENNFFNMFEMLRNLLSDINVERSYPRKKENSYRLIDLAYKEFCKEKTFDDKFENRKNDTFNKASKDIYKFSVLSLMKKKEKLLNYKDEYIGRYSLYLNPFFRELYQILKYIDEKFRFENGKTIKNRKFYTNMIRAILSNQIYTLLAINAVSDENDTHHFYKYRRLIEKYELLEHLTFSIDIEDYNNAAHSYLNGYTESNKRIIELQTLYQIAIFYDKKAFGNRSNAKRFVEQLSKADALKKVIGENIVNYLEEKFLSGE